MSEVGIDYGRKVMNKIKIKEIMEFPWVLVSCGAWAILAIYREQKVRYLKWRYRQIKRERDHFKSLLEDKNKHP